jgi:hypothetical protein
LRGSSRLGQNLKRCFVVYWCAPQGHSAEGLRFHRCSNLFNPMVPVRS